MSLWYLNIFGTWIEVVNHFEKLLCKKKMDLEILWNDLIRYCWESTCE